MCIKIPEQQQVLISLSLWGDAAQVGIRISPTSELEPALVLVTSHLEGVGNYLAACAATKFVHLHTTSFRCAYCTLHFAGCQVFYENSLKASECTDESKWLEKGEKWISSL